MPLMHSQYHVNVPSGDRRAHQAYQNARLAMAAAVAMCDGSALSKRNRRRAGLACDRYSERTLRSQATARWVLKPGSRNFSQA